MTDPVRRASPEDLVRESRALREWSRTLRSWSEGTRRRTGGARRTWQAQQLEASLRARTGEPATPQPPAEPVEPSGADGDATEVPAEESADEVSMGEVPVTDLFVILVENHDFEVREAVRQLLLGMLAAGYPEDAENLSASDAMDILEAILGSERG